MFAHLTLGRRLRRCCLRSSSLASPSRRPRGYGNAWTLRSWRRRSAQGRSSTISTRSCGHAQARCAGGKCHRRRRTHGARSIHSGGRDLARVPSQAATDAALCCRAYRATRLGGAGRRRRASAILYSDLGEFLIVIRRFFSRIRSSSSTAPASAICTRPAWRRCTGPRFHSRCSEGARCTRDSSEMRPRYRRDVPEIAPRYSRDLAEIYIRDARRGVAGSRVTVRS